MTSLRMIELSDNNRYFIELSTHAFVLKNSDTMRDLPEYHICLLTPAVVMVDDLAHHLIQQIEDICITRGVRLTKQRKRVFELICASQKAASAYELLESLKESEPQAKPPTIYRALDFLLEQGFIHRVESTNSYISCGSCNVHKHFSQLFICDQCNDVIELQDDNLVALLEENAQKHHFQITNHVIESHGICQQCVSELEK